MTVTYEVGESSGGGHLDIDFFVSTDPVYLGHECHGGLKILHDWGISWPRLVRRCTETRCSNLKGRRSIQIINNPKGHSQCQQNEAVNSSIASPTKCHHTRVKCSGGSYTPIGPSAPSPAARPLSQDAEAHFSFNVHGVLYVENEEQTAPVEQEIRDLSSGLQMVKDEQAYLVVRERVHRNSTLSLSFQ